LRVRLAFIQLVDGAPVGQGDSLSLDLSASVCVGSDAGAPVMTDYKPPFAFTGTVKEALVDLIPTVMRADRCGPSPVFRLM
jgi:hypothetical protein